jgi:hypothetical protein
LDQPFKTRGILNDEFLKPVMNISSKTYASKADGVDSETAEAIAILDQQVLQSRATSEDSEMLTRSSSSFLSLGR